MLITFVTDGNHTLGMGHVYRCLALAELLKSRFPAAEFIFLAASPEARRKIDESKRGRIVKTAPPCDLLIFDHLSILPCEIDKARPLANMVVSFDDTGPGHDMVDLAVNALYSCRLERPVGSNTICLNGLSFAMIDPGFSVNYEFRAKPCNLFITQGGADTFGLVPRLIDLADKALPSSACFHIHTGPAFAHEAPLQAALARLDRPHQRHQRVADLPGLMAQMDMAIAAGGVMSLELAAVGVPLLLITGEAMEQETMTQLADQGAALCLPFYNEGLQELPTALAKLWADPTLRKSLSERARVLIDAKAGHRIVDAIATRLAA